MKFTLNTKPLSDALNLGVINSNVSNFNRRSGVVQLTATNTKLTLNIQSNLITTQIELRGQGDSPEPVVNFVDAILFKQLVNTLDTNIITLILNDNGVVITSGKSEFTLSNIVDAEGFRLDAPIQPDATAVNHTVDPAGWKFIQDNQMFAISTAFIHPVYTKVWVGQSGDVIVGDFDTSLFTHSTKGNLQSTCLLSDTIINLFTSLPEGAKIYNVGKDYVIEYTSETFNYITQLTPMYEDDPDVGSYHSDIILQTLQHSPEFGKLPVTSVNKLLSQASLLSTSSDAQISFTLASSKLTISDYSVQSEFDIKGSSIPDFKLVFKLDTIRKVLNNYRVDELSFYPFINGEESIGIVVWDDNLTTVLAGLA